MSTSKTDQDDQPSSKEPSHAMMLLGTIGDTTWRMFVPTIGLLLLGDYLDRSFQTKPLLLLVGVITGMIISGLLIMRQLKE